MSSDDRVTAFGAHLVQVHDQLREQLARLRTEARRPDGPPRTLPAHCLAFCSLLTEHHTVEDTAVFPAVAARHPELAGAVDRLRADHHLVTDLLRQLDDLATTISATPDPEETRDLLGRLDGLAAILESHFTYEERTLTTALNTLGGDRPIRSRRDG